MEGPKGYVESIGGANPDFTRPGRAMMSGMDYPGTAVSLRHTLAALAYRTTRALENAPPDFAKFELGPHPKTPAQILAHMGDLMDWSLTLVEGNQKWQNSSPLPWNAEVSRFFGALESLDQAIAATELPSDTANRLFQGPIADALTHTGQLAMLRRLAGCPIRGENYVIADIAAGRVRIDQPPARQAF
jgi:hypothetical protein